MFLRKQQYNFIVFLLAIQGYVLRFFVRYCKAFLMCAYLLNSMLISFLHLCNINWFKVVFSIKLTAYTQGRIKAGADGAAAPGPHPNIGPPLH